MKKFAKMILKKMHLLNLARRIKKKIVKTPKIGASYSVFDGLELILASIKSIRKSVDYINVVYQDVSYAGDNGRLKDFEYLQFLKKKKLIDKVLIYKNNPNLKRQINEVNKRNLGLKDLKKAKCTHIITMDVDECYETKWFDWAKEYIIRNDITSSCCQFYFYLKNPCLRGKEPRELFIPFIQKIYHHVKFVFHAEQYCMIDETRLLNQKRSNRCFVFDKSRIICHHFSFIRLNIYDKYKNTSSNDYQTKKTLDERKRFVCRLNSYTYPNKLKLWNNDVYNVVKVKDVFNINKSIDFYLKFIENN